LTIVKFKCTQDHSDALDILMKNLPNGQWEFTGGFSSALLDLFVLMLNIT